MNDHEILEQIAESRDNIRRELRNEIEGLFDKERKMLLERARLLFSVAKWSLGALAVLFTLLGIKAWGDLQANVETYFKGKLENTFRIGDNASPLRRTIDQLVNRAVVNALYTQILRERQEKRSEAEGHITIRESAQIQPEEFDRLIMVLKSPHTSYKLFHDAIIVLSTLNLNVNNQAIASRTVADLLAYKSGPEAGLMSIDDEKRIAILSYFANSSAVDDISCELLSQPVSDRVKVSAINRLKKDNYVEAVNKLVRLVDTTEDSYVKSEGLLAIARFQPNHDRIKKVCSELLSSTEKENLPKCLILASELAASYSHDRLFETPDVVKKYKPMILEMAIPLAKKAFESELKISRSGDWPNRTTTAVFQERHGFYRVYQIDDAIYDNDFASTLLSVASSDSHRALVRYLTILTFIDDYNQKNRRGISVTAQLGPKSEIVTKDGTTVNYNDVKNRTIEVASIQPRLRGIHTPSSQKYETSEGGADSNLEILIRWVDLKGKAYQEKVKTIKNVQFSVRKHSIKQLRYDIFDD